MQGPKNLQGREIDQINWNLIQKWAMNKQNAQALKKLYNKIRSMSSKSSATRFCQQTKCDVHEFEY